jgi:hypothetical protein
MRKWILITCLLLTVYGHSQNTIKINWDSDLEFLKVELPKNHFAFYHKKGEVEFLEGIKEISLQKDKLSDLGIVIKLQQLIAAFGDSHTKTRWTQFIDKNKVLPLKLLWFKDGIFIVNTAEENGKILGHKIVKINGKTIDVIVDSLSTVLTVDNRSIIKNEIPNLLTYVQLLGHFGIADSDNIKLQLENQQGETLLYEIKPAYVERKNIVSIKRDNLALYYQNEKAFFIDHNLKTDNVYYLKYNQCWSRENPPPDFRGDVMQLPSFQEFQNRVIETIKNSSFDKVVFDLRNNSGGSSAQGKELIRRISAIKDVNERGKLYVVLGRRTFSSAVLNAFDFKEMTKAIFVGEETSGKPNHFGEVRYFTLPGSGLKVFYSTNYFKRSKEDLTTIIPDYIIESNFKDYKEGRDPVYEWILKQ